MLEALDTGGVWSIARGLARNVDAYKGHLAACDLPRRNDLDGRGHLSEETLTQFTSFFLTTCIDQVTFMENLMQPDQLRTRILLWAEEEIRMDKLPPKSGALLEAVLYRGEIPRGGNTGDFRSQRTQQQPLCLRADRSGRAYVRKHARAVASRLPRSARLTLDAGIVSVVVGFICNTLPISFPTLRVGLVC